MMRSLSPNRAFAAAIAAEVVYIAGRTLIRAHVGGDIATELAITAWRALSIAFYVALYFHALQPAWRAPAARRMHALLVGVVLLDLAVILMAGYGQQLNWDLRLAYILTTPFVAVREELFYRFILQNELERRISPVWAIMIATLLFVMFHIGAQPMNIFTVTSMTAGGILLGVIYQRTRSLKLAIALHLVLDVAYMLSSPVLAPLGILLGYFIVIFGALLAWSFDHVRERKGT